MNQPVLMRLQTMIQRNRLHHGFFFVGSGQATHQQKVQTAYGMAAYFFHQEDASVSMDTWHKRIEDKHHPDFFHASGEDQEMKREHIQELIQWIMVAPTQSRQKFALIEFAGRMNVSAANTLLKTLEEPPPHATLILLAPSRDNVLQTLRSRMMTVQFPQILQATDPDDLPGWMPTLQTMLRTEQFSPKAIFDFSVEAAKDRPALKHLFEAVEQHLRNRMRETHQTTAFHHYEKLFTQALALENDLYKRYGNIALGLETFFLQWRQR